MPSKGDFPFIFLCLWPLPFLHHFHYKKLQICLGVLGFDSLKKPSENRLYLSCLLFYPRCLVRCLTQSSAACLLSMNELIIHLYLFLHFTDKNMTTLLHVPLGCPLWFLKIATFLCNSHKLCP